ncbi:MAG: hypothetical protein ABID67_00845, partial [Candidatus Nealsonbacteria bacterium]
MEVIIMSLAVVCEKAVKENHAKVVFGSVIQLTGSIDQEKLRQLEEDYGAAIEARFSERRKKEIKA